MLFYQDNAPCHKSIATMEKLHELHFELLPHQRNSPDLASSKFLLIADPKRMLPGKRFSTHKEIILEN